jgi:hypothetical protein
MTTTATPTLIRDPWRRLWHFFTSDGLYAAAVIAGALLLLVAAQLPQTPAHNPIAYSRWLSETQARWGSLFDPLNALGLFTVTSSLLFRLTLALLGLCSALRLIDQLDRLRRTDRAVSRRSSLAAILVYSGTVIVLLGLFLGTFIDYRVDEVVVSPGTMTNIPGTTYAVRLDALDNDRATVALLSQTEVIAQGVIAEKHPLHDGVAVYLDRIGPALNVSATQGVTQVLNLQSTANSPAQTQVLLLFTSDQNEGFVAAPQVNLVLRIEPVGAEQFTAQIFQSASGKDFGRQSFKPGETISIEGTTFRFEPAAYIVVSLANQPSHWVVVLGIMVTVLGLLGLALWPIGPADTRRDRIILWTTRLAWLIWTIFVVGQLINAYPRTASFGYAVTSLAAGLAAWILFAGSLVVQRRTRVVLLGLGLVALVITLSL